MTHNGAELDQFDDKKIIMMKKKLISNQKTKNKIKVYTKMIFLFLMFRLVIQYFNVQCRSHVRIDLIGFLTMIVGSRFESITATQSSRLRFSGI